MWDSEFSGDPWLGLSASTARGMGSILDCGTKILLAAWSGQGIYTQGFLGGSEVKVSASNTGDLGSIPGLGRSPGEGNGNRLQYSCLENPMDGEAWWATVHGVVKSQTRLSDLIY